MKFNQLSRRLVYCFQASQSLPQITVAKNGLAAENLGNNTTGIVHRDLGNPTKKEVTKPILGFSIRGFAAMSTGSQAVQTAQSYYDGAETDLHYVQFWGGEHIHYGIYHTPGESIHDASNRTVETVAKSLKTLGPSSHVIDLGSGYGGSARYLAKTYGCKVTCLNLSEVQNIRNQQFIQEQNLGHLIEVRQGSFEDIPFPTNAFDIVWSQEALVHAGDRAKVFSEAARILKPGGEFIFTDPMQSEACPPGVLQPAFDRLEIKDMGDIQFYRNNAAALGFEEIKFMDLSQHALTHYIRFGEEVKSRYEDLVKLTSPEFASKTLKSVDPWIESFSQGHMQWGIVHFQLKQ